MAHLITIFEELIVKLITNWWLQNLEKDWQLVNKKHTNFKGNDLISSR